MRRRAKIAVLGWGSLIWDPGSLANRVKGPWKRGGPRLPIEFSRVSVNLRKGALTLVIDPQNGTQVPTRFILSSRTDPEDAASDLQAREGNPRINNIGLVDLTNGYVRTRWETVSEVIREWAKEHEIDAVIWTDLSSNFQDYTGKLFSVENGIEYLDGLSGEVAQKAREYIENAPDEVDTKLRRTLKEKG